MPSPKLATSTCRVCLLGDDRERILIAIARDPRATRTRIVREMHITTGREAQRELFASLPVHYVNGQWIAK